MKEISAATVRDTVARLCAEAGHYLGADVLEALKRAAGTEESPLGRDVLNRLLENAAVAARDNIPLCQDCGTAVVFLEVGQDVHIGGGYLYDAVNEGVRRGYTDAYLRKSMVAQPFSVRQNTGDNTPAVIHAEIVPGDQLKISLMAKGGGAENMTRLGLLRPGEGKESVLDFITSAVAEAGGKPCPPLIVGVGIGGTPEMTLLLAKKALLRPVGQSAADPEVAELEREALARINNLGLGPLGWGGRTTALAVHAAALPAHLASLPVAVNLQCHSARHKEAVL
jgi:fumarate hydratase subunit alpha